MLSIDIPFLIFLLYLFGFQADFLLCAFAFSLGGNEVRLSPLRHSEV